MFENLSDRFEKAFQRIKGESTITEANIAETTKEIRRALVDADVNYSVAKRFANQVKDKAIGQEVLNSVRPGQLLVKITQEELATLYAQAIIQQWDFGVRAGGKSGRLGCQC